MSYYSPTNEELQREDKAELLLMQQRTYEDQLLGWVHQARAEFLRLKLDSPPIHFPVRFYTEEHVLAFLDELAVLSPATPEDASDLAQGVFWP